MVIVLCAFQAAIWHCLNHYAYPDAIFLAERLCAEGKCQIGDIDYMSRNKIGHPDLCVCMK